VQIFTSIPLSGCRIDAHSLHLPRLLHLRDRADGAHAPAKDLDAAAPAVLSGDWRAWSLHWRRPQGSDHLAEVAALQDAFIGFQLGIPFFTAARVNLQ
jgi:hypothetical protein